MSLERGGEMRRGREDIPREDDVGLAAGPDTAQSLGSLEECSSPLSQISHRLY